MVDYTTYCAIIKRDENGTWSFDQEDIKVGQFFLNSSNQQIKINNDGDKCIIRGFNLGGGGYAGTISYRNGEWKESGDMSCPWGYEWAISMSPSGNRAAFKIYGLDFSYECLIYQLPNLHKKFWVVGSEARIYRYDEQSSWVTQTCSYTGDSNYHLTAVWAVNDSNVYAIGWDNSGGTNKNIFIKTTDSGNTWESWDDPGLSNTYKVTCIFGRGDYVYVGYSDFATYHDWGTSWNDVGGIYRYSISGDTWSTWMSAGDFVPLSMWVDDRNPSHEGTFGFYVSGYSPSGDIQLKMNTGMIPDTFDKSYVIFISWGGDPFAGHFIHREDTVLNQYNTPMSYFQPENPARDKTNICWMYDVAPDGLVNSYGEATIYLGKFAPGDNSGGGMQLYSAPDFNVWWLGTKSDESGDFSIERKLTYSIGDAVSETYSFTESAGTTKWWGPGENLGGAIFGLGSTDIRMVMWGDGVNKGCYIYDKNTNTWNKDLYYTFLVEPNFFSHAIHGVWSSNPSFSVPYLDNEDPYSDEIDVSVSTNVNFDILEPVSGVDQESISVYINCDSAFEGSTSTFISPFNGPSSTETVISYGYRFVLDNINYYTSGSTVSVRVVAKSTNVYLLFTETKLPNNNIQYAFFGCSVSINGDFCIVGAFSEESGIVDIGVVHIFKKVNDEWIAYQQIIADDATTHDWFGYSVSLSGDYLISGAPYDDEVGPDSGSVYIFTNTSGVWTQQQKLTANDQASYDLFGTSVAISGDTCVIGSPYDDDDGSYSGSAYIFTRSGSAWTEQQKLTASDASDHQYFGWSVAIDGDTCIIGATENDNGAVYVFTRTAGVWTEQQKLIADDQGIGTYDFFGFSVSIDGDTCIIGSVYNDALAPFSGAAYIFTRTAGIWTQQQKLIASDGAEEDQFGYSVSISGDTCIVGAIEKNGVYSNSGASYVFKIKDGIWYEIKKLTASDAGPYSNDLFGYSVSVDANTWVVGAKGKREGPTLSGNGAAYIYDSYQPTMDETYYFTIESVGTPYLYAQYPLPSQIIYDNSIDISFQILEPNYGVDPDSILIYVNGSLAYSGELLNFQSTFIGPNSSRNIIENGYSFVLDNTEIYSSGYISIRAIANSIGGTYKKMDETYNFYLSSLPSPEAVEKKDLVIIEDSADGFKKKKLQLSTIFTKTVEQEEKGLFYANEVLDSTIENSFELNNMPESNSNIPYDRTIQVFKDGELLKYDETLPDTNSWKYNSTTNTIYFNNDSGSKYQFIYWTNGSTLWSNSGGSGGDFPPYVFGLSDYYNMRLASNLDYGFPSSVATDYRTIAVGEMEAGKVYIYYYRYYWGWDNPRGYYTVPPLYESYQVIDGGGSNFGKSIAIYGDVLVIGAPSHGTKGAIYIYIKNNAYQDTLDIVGQNMEWIDWVFFQKIIPSGDCVDFGSSISIYENRIAVGSLYPGEVYIYKDSGLLWEEEDVLTNSLPTSLFGFSVDLKDDNLIVGAPTETGNGAAYIYIYNSGNWFLQQRLVASDGSVADNFGRSVSIYGDKCIIGAPFTETQGYIHAGATYIYERSAGVWGNELRFDPNTINVGSGTILNGGHFGNSVAMRDNIIVITSPLSGEYLSRDDGNVWVFRFINGEWQHTSIYYNNTVVSYSEGNNGHFLSVSDNSIVFSQKYYYDEGGLHGAVVVRKLSDS